MLIDDREPIRYSANRFHCCVNCGRRFGSQARTTPDARSSACSPSKPVAMVLAPAGRVVGALRLEEERRVQRQAQVGAGAFHVLRDAVAAAEHPPLTHAVGGADARLPAVVVRLVERAAVAVLSGRQRLGVAQVEVRLAVVLLDERRGVAPAQAKVEGERVGDLEVVGGVERHAALQVRPRLRQRAAALALHLIEQEVGEGHAGERRRCTG